MKYTREQVKAMTQEEYESAICKELNNAGFRQEFNGEQFEYEPDEFDDGTWSLTLKKIYIKK